MKKYLRFSNVLLVALLFLVGCNNAENVLEPISSPIANYDEDAAYDNLLADLVALNVETFGENYRDFPTDEVELRAGGRIRWWQWLIIGFADAAGGLIPSGNLATAIAASTFAWNAFKYEASLDNVKPSRTVQTELVCLKNIAFPTYSDAGEIHNKVIAHLYRQYGEQFYSTAFSDMDRITMTLTAMTDVTGDRDWKWGNSEQSIYTKIYPLVEVFTSTHDFEALIIQLKNMYPERMQEFSVFGEVMRGFQNLDINRDTGQYARNAMNIVRSSNIPAISRIRLYDCVTIGNASVRMWKQTEMQNAYKGN